MGDGFPRRLNNCPINDRRILAISLTTYLFPITEFNNKFSSLGILRNHLPWRALFLAKMFPISRPLFSFGRPTLSSFHKKPFCHFSIKPETPTRQVVNCGSAQNCRTRVHLQQSSLHPPIFQLFS